jgi:hypothetical protein
MKRNFSDHMGGKSFPKARWAFQFTSLLLWVGMRGGAQSPINPFTDFFTECG